MLDDPQNATFYTWCLEDARDAPYATFRFYYRSWDSLRNLNLIPDSYSKRKAELSWDSKSTDAHRDATDSLGFSFGFEPDDNSIFSDDKSSITTQDTPRTQPSQDGLTSSYLLRSPRECVQLDLASQKVPQPSKARRDAITASYLQRPLPPLPLNRPQSRSSVASRTPSITPSLLPYLDSSSVDESDAEVDVASIQTFQKSNSRGLLVESASRATLDVSPSGSASDNETSLSYTTESPSQPMLFSDNYLSTTGSILDRHIAQFTSRETEVALSLDLSASRYEPCSTNALLSAPRVGALRTEDPDWTRPTPSPVHRELAQGTAHRIRSTRPRGQPTPMPGNPWCVEKARPCCQSVTPTGHYVEPVDAYPAWI